MGNRGVKTLRQSQPQNHLPKRPQTVSGTRIASRPNGALVFTDDTRAFEEEKEGRSPDGRAQFCASVQLGKTNTRFGKTRYGRGTFGNAGVLEFRV